jgi:hypothetical protein
MANPAPGRPTRIPAVASGLIIALAASLTGWGLGFPVYVTVVLGVAGFWVALMCLSTKPKGS